MIRFIPVFCKSSTTETSNNEIPAPVKKTTGTTNQEMARKRNPDKQ